MFPLKNVARKELIEKHLNTHHYIHPHSHWKNWGWRTGLYPVAAALRRAPQYWRSSVEAADATDSSCRARGPGSQAGSWRCHGDRIWCPTGWMSPQQACASVTEISMINIVCLLYSAQIMLVLWPTEFIKKFLLTIQIRWQYFLYTLTHSPLGDVVIILKM